MNFEFRFISSADSCKMPETKVWAKMTGRNHTDTVGSDSQVATRFRREIEGEVLFDSFSRGRYSTDASIYQIEPAGVVIAKSIDDIRRAISLAADAGLSVVPRGGGSSQNGQSIGPGIVIDTTKHLDSILDFSPGARRVTVQPGIVLDRLNAFLKPHGLHFAVDPSTSSRATIGGMAGNNSSGAHSIQYGLTADNVVSIDAILASGEQVSFAGFPEDLNAPDVTPAYRDLMAPLFDLGRDEADEIEARFPKVLRRVGGYNIDSLIPGAARNRGNAAARLLVGSEGTLGFSTALTLKLHALPKYKVLGICHFPTFRAAMEAAQHIVELKPAGVELIDATMIDLAREIPMFCATVEEFVKGAPAAVLVVEFAGNELNEQLRSLKRLDDLMVDLGHADSVVEALDAKFQGRITAVRKAGLNIMMSMKGDGKPVSIIEDCAVPLEHLADYTSQLTEVFARHGTTGTWYAHASVGCLHVRPVLNMKQDLGATAMRAIAEEAFDLVRRYKGSHSGEHGDGISRSEFHGAMFGDRMVRSFEAVKDTFDPKGLFNPGKIVRSYRMDDRDLFRFRPDYEVKAFDTALDWSEWGGIGGAAEMCNNNGACRKFDVDVMCPSFRATRDEQHSTRGRANTLRLALSGQLGPDALTSEQMAETMQLCVGCKACKRECPTGVDMARLKIEILHQQARKNGIKLRDRLIAYLPRYAPLASKQAPFLNLMAALPGTPWLVEKLTGFSRKRALPKWRRDRFVPDAHSIGPEDGPEVVLLCDTFNANFEPDTCSDAASVLVAAGYRVHFPKPADGGRALCCGRTFLSAGLIDEAKAEARRMIEALSPYFERGIPVVGLEPSCLLTLRDEYLGLLPGPRTHALAGHALMFEEFLAREADAGRLQLPLQSKEGTRVLLHGHCHQKAFDLMGSIGKSLAIVPGVEVEIIESSCCGMAGAFGYGADTHDVSMAMAEDALLPAVREAGTDAVILADGTSCRQQIRGGAGKNALHVATFIKSALIDDAGAGKK